jgi:hypothetical protein
MVAEASFHRRVLALESVITDQERKELLAQWALMTSKEDYAAINAQFESLGVKYHQKLPKRLP